MSDPTPCVPASAATVAAELEQLLQEAHDAYRAGDYARALSLCQPVRACAHMLLRMGLHAFGGRLRACIMLRLC